MELQIKRVIGQFNVTRKQGCVPFKAALYQAPVKPDMEMVEDENGGIWNVWEARTYGTTTITPKQGPFPNERGARYAAHASIMPDGYTGRIEP